MISVKTTVLNLSEAGMLADQVQVIDAKTGEIAVPQGVEGHELYDMEFRDEEKLCAGIHFKEMKQVHKEMIREYVRATDVSK